MKTIALCLEYPIHLKGGASVIVKTLLQGLRDSYRLILVSPDTEESVGSLLFDGAIMKHIYWNPAGVTLRQSRKFADDLFSLGVDLAHFHCGGVFGWGNRRWWQSPIIYSAHRGIPCVFSSHLVVPILNGYRSSLRPKWLKMGLLPLAWSSKVITVLSEKAEILDSRQNYEMMKRWYWPVRSKFKYIYHSRLKNNSYCYVDKPREKVILCVGHIAMRKGQHILAEAFAQIADRYPEWSLVLAGPDIDSVCLLKVREIIDRYSIKNIKHLGEYEHPEDLMKKAAIYVQPSIHESYGLALQEALFYGCACIGSYVEGIPELIEDEVNGLLVKAEEIEELSNALEGLIQKKDLRNRLSAQAHESIIKKKLSAENMIKQHTELYESILNK